MSEYIKVNPEDRIYRAITFLLLLLSVFTIQNNDHNNQFQFIVIIISIIIALLGLVKFTFDGLTFQKIIFIAILVAILCCFKFNNFLVIPACLAIAFVNYSPELVLHSYYISSIWNFIITALIAIIGLSPMTNSSDGVITLGYSNENSLGLIITFLAILFFIQFYKDRMKTHWAYLKLMFVLLTLIVDYFIIDDKTMIVVFAFFILLSLLLKANNFLALFIAKVIGIILPFFLLYMSFVFTENYGSTQLSLRLNEMLSNRLYMWNWYYQKMGISFLPPSTRLSGFNFWGTIDGSYTLFLLQYGIVLTILITFALLVSNYLLLKNNKHTLFSIMLSFELGAFCENVLQFYTLTFVLIFAICAIYPGWTKKNSKFNNYS